MKNFLFLISCFLLLPSARTQSEYLRITPAAPKPGESIRFEYDLTKSPLRQSVEPVDVLAYEYAGESPNALPVMVQVSEGKITGTFTLGKDALVGMLAFQSGPRWDNNSGEGYFILLNDAAGKPMPESKAAQAVLYRDWGGLFELNRKTTTAFELLDQAFAAKPALRTKYFFSYVSNLLSVKRSDAGKTEAIAFLDEVAKSTSLSEKDWIGLARLYERLTISEKATTIRDNIRKTYPKGTFVRQERRQAMRAEADIVKYQSLIDAYLKDFPPATPEEKEEASELYFNLGNKAAEKSDWALLKNTAKQMLPASRASLYNNVAWELAENDHEMEMAKQMAAEATDWAKKEMTMPEGSKKAYQSAKDWENNRKDNFAQYADTYAFILNKTNDPQAAAALQAQVVDLTKGENAEMNERYATYLENAKAPDLRYRLEGFIIHGQATDNMKTQFKRLFAAEDRSTAGTDAYLAGLEKIARLNKKKELAAKMLDQPAPGFKLKNLAGEEVSLESLKGKVVVVDFWATWCGPCKSSFPGMQQALNNFKEDSKVAFVFVDTWERVADKAKAAGDFIQSKGYTFNVLMDTEDQVVASYGVSGIPTKFIVDAAGKIRFKSVGYIGSSEALVDELTAMIELAKEQP